MVGLAAAPASLFAPRPQATREIVIVIIFTAIVTTALAFTALMWAQAHVSATEAAVILAFEPVAAALTSIIWYHEPLTIAFVAGASLILCAMIVSQTSVTIRTDGPHPRHQRRRHLQRRACASSRTALAGRVGDVIVVAPDREQSAASHALTLNRPLRLLQARGERMDRRRHADGLREPRRSCKLLKETRPDIVVSGINFGPNLGDDVTYSGTISAAFEGALLDIPSIAFSALVGEHFSFDRASASPRS